MKPGLSLRVSQHLALTPQLQQSIRLLQLSTLELSQEVEQMLDDNPFLEMEPEQAPREEFGLAQVDVPASADDTEPALTSYSASETYPETTATSALEEPTNLDSGIEQSWDGDGSVDLRPDDAEWGGDAPPRTAGKDDGEEFDALSVAHVHESLTAHLQRQVLGMRMGAEDRAALNYLIESLNEDGYLEDSLESLARGLAGEHEEHVEDLIHHFTVALGLLQHLDPIGVGARHLGECLGLQLKDMLKDLQQSDEGQSTPSHLATCQLAIAICQHPTELLARRDSKRLAVLCGETESHVRAAFALIARLEPRPGRRFVDVERNFVVPDVIVTRAAVTAAGQVRFIVKLNADVMPRLKVHDIYANVLRQHRGGDHAALAQRLQEARWFIKNIQQRFDTILRVSNAIVERQKSFFVHGELAMRPLVLREIADELGLHESTISRVTTAKYMATPFGTFELKYFFGSALGTETGGNASSTAVRALIKQFVQAESPQKPLSDNQISDLLKEQGIECARRTVAKYRDALRIAPANLRKAL